MIILKDNEDMTSNQILSWLVSIHIAGIFFYANICTAGTFNFFDSNHSFPYAFNYYLLSVLDGRVDIPAEVINYEGFYDYEGRAYAYFGIVPALFRAVFLPFFDLEVVKVNRAVMFFVTCTTVAVAQLLLFKIVRWRSHRDKAFQGNYYLIIGALCLWFMSPMTFLVANSAIYNEPIAFALLFFVMYIFVILQTILKNRDLNLKSFIALSTLSVLALHSRPHIGLCLYIGTCLLMAWVYYLSVRENEKIKIWSLLKNTARFYIPLLVLLAGGMGILLINYLKWGDAFSLTLDERQGPFFAGEGFSVRYHAAEKDGMLNFIRIFPNLLYHFIIDVELYRFMRYLLDLSYVRLERPDAKLLFLWPIWIMGTYFFIEHLFKNKMAHNSLSTHGKGYLAILSSTALLSALLILSYRTITLRYKTEIWPIFLLGFFLFLVFCSVKKLNRMRAIVLVIIALSILYNIFVSIQYTYQWKDLGYFERDPEFAQCIVDNATNPNFSEIVGRDYQEVNCFLVLDEFKNQTE